MGFSRQEYWSGLPCPSPGDLPDPGIEPVSLMPSALAGRLFTTSASWEALFSTIAALRGCVSFSCPAKWISYTYTYIWVGFPELYSRFSLVIYFIHSITVWICRFQSPSSSLPSLPLWCPYICSLHLCLYLYFAASWFDFSRSKSWGSTWTVWVGKESKTSLIHQSCTSLVPKRVTTGLKAGESWPMPGDIIMFAFYRNAMSSKQYLII